MEEISRGWMWKYIPRPGEKVPKPRGSAGVDGMRIGTGGDGVEVAKTVWMTRTRSSNDRTAAAARSLKSAKENASFADGASSKSKKSDGDKMKSPLKKSTGHVNPGASTSRKEKQEAGEGGGGKDDAGAAAAVFTSKKLEKKVTFRTKVGG